VLVTFSTEKVLILLFIGTIIGSDDKKIIIIIAISLVGIISIFVYFVTGISSKYPPIEEYNYSGTLNELITGLRNYAAVNNSVTFKIKDTTGNEESGYATYMSVELEDVEYNLKCEEDHDSNKAKTVIILVGLFDKRQNIGGYSKDSKDINALADKLYRDILISLKVNKVPK
jgi:hypothetical protein